MEEKKIHLELNVFDVLIGLFFTIFVLWACQGCLRDVSRAVSEGWHNGISTDLVITPIEVPNVQHLDRTEKAENKG
jgi:hypothetical protein